MTHLAMAFAIAHPGVTCALVGARTMEQLDDLLGSVSTFRSTDEILDRIDEIVPARHRHRHSGPPRPTCRQRSSARLFVADPSKSAPPCDRTRHDLKIA